MTTNATLGTIRAYKHTGAKLLKFRGRPNTSLERANMIFDESKHNLLDIEAASIEADAHAEILDAEADAVPVPMEHLVADAWWATLHAKAAAKAVPDDVDHDADDWSPWDDDDGECPDDDEPDPYGFDFGGADGSEF